MKQKASKPDTIKWLNIIFVQPFFIREELYN